MKRKFNFDYIFFLSKLNQKEYLKIMDNFFQAEIKIKGSEIFMNKINMTHNKKIILSISPISCPLFVIIFEVIPASSLVSLHISN